MPLIIAVAAEQVSGERRVALAPETAKKYQALGALLQIQAGAGLTSQFADADYVGAQIKADLASSWRDADIVLTVAPPSLADIALLPEHSMVIGLLAPYASRERLAAFNARRITAFALELLPRISRAQSMDALSSQGACSGYQCGLLGASLSSKFFPMLTTAAGTVRPARALVVGAGVAGLQAIATCKRLGAMVEAYDVRAASREQVESLGAKFIDTGVSADGSGGYARELTSEEKALQAEKLAKAMAQADVVITTAALPGRKAPVIVTEAMVQRMKQGAVIVDMAAESGGNCALTRAGELVTAHGVQIFGPLNLPSRMATHASELYARNLYNFLSPWIKDGQLAIDWLDEVVAGSVLCRDGKTVHAGVRQILGEV